MHRTLHFQAIQSDSGKRLDKFLSEKGQFVSRSQIQKLIENGGIKIDCEVCKASYKLKPGQSIEVVLEDRSDIKIKAQEIPIEIIFEDQSIIVINKPAGMVVHPAPGHNDNTLVNAIMAKVKDLRPIMGELRPGIVHRLDKETSGVIVVAKDEFSLANLSSQFKNRIVEKVYHAIAVGQPKENNLIAIKSIGRSRVDRKKMSVTAKKGREAITFFKVLHRKCGLSYIEAKPKTGRTHQIRVHLSDLGFPIVGDKIYLKEKRLCEIEDGEIRQLVSDFPRQALHAYSISFLHPVSGDKLFFSVNVPQDIQALAAKVGFGLK
jgi:23S rRNA pseudouridine1911/1915/1917 synthase